MILFIPYESVTIFIYAFHGNEKTVDKKSRLGFKNIRENAIILYTRIYMDHN
jgi:hypothetical protein